MEIRGTGFCPEYVIYFSGEDAVMIGEVQCVDDRSWAYILFQLNTHKIVDTMKYHLSQKVILLDTEYKPAGVAIILNLNDESRKYEVDFTYPDRKESQKIWVPEERLLMMQDMANAV